MTAENEQTKRFWQALERSDIAVLDQCYAQDPGIIEFKAPALGPWLHIAARRGQLEAVVWLMARGVDPNEPPTSRHRKGNALSVAASKGFRDLVEILHQAGAALETGDPSANPLFGAILACSSDTVDYLLNAGIDSEVQYSGYDGPYMDALAFALERGAVDLAGRIALVQADGQRDDAQRRIDVAFDVAKQNNPGAVNYPQPPHV